MTFLRRHCYAAAGALLLAAALLFLQMPLLNYLGYEFSTALALILPLVLWLPARCEHEIGKARGEPLARTAKRVAVRCGALLLIPLAAASMNMIFVRNCAYGEGLLYYICQPLVTAAWALSLALCAMESVRRPLLIYAAVLVVVLLYPLYLGWATPQIYSYNFIYGFFPGISYDEIVRITPQLLLFRGVTILCAVLFLALAQWARTARKKDAPGRRTAPAVALAAGILVLAAWFSRVPLGFESGAPERTLSGTLRTDHFTIHYAPGSFRQEELPWLALLHEYNYARVTQALQVKGVPVDSYVYPDADAKLAVVGTSTTNIAKPWRREIHLDKSSLDATLEHELVHVEAGEFGMPLIRAHYHIGLVEGLAMAVDGEFGNRTLHEYAAAVLKFGMLRNPRSLITPLGFATHASSLSYVVMGSFCRYLIDRYGLFRFKELYGGRSPDAAYGKPYATLIGEWQTYLDRIPVPAEWRNHVAYYFMRPSIFAKECVRTVALLNDDGYRLLAANDPKAAEAKFTRALGAGWNSESYGGLVRAAFAAARYDTVALLMESALADSTRGSGVMNLLLIYGDALWHGGRGEEARAVYRTALGLDLSDRFNERLAIRLAALDDTALAPRFPAFLAARTDSAAAASIENLVRATSNPLVKFLRGRIELQLEEYGRAADDLSGVKFSSPILDAAREQSLARALFMNGDFAQARAHYWLSLNDVANRASAESVGRAIERCEWYQKNATHYLSR